MPPSAPLQVAPPPVVTPGLTWTNQYVTTLPGEMAAIVGQVREYARAKAENRTVNTVSSGRGSVLRMSWFQAAIKDLVRLETPQMPSHRQWTTQAMPRKLKVPDVEHYRGTANPVQWLHTIHQYFCVTQTPVEMWGSMATMYFQGRAASWFRAFEQQWLRETTEQIGWLHVCIGLSMAFLTPYEEERALAELDNMAQGTLSIDVYTDLYRQAVDKVERTEQDKVHAYVRGLNPSTRAKTRESRPTTFQEAAAIAKEHEQQYQLNKAERQVSKKNHKVELAAADAKGKNKFFRKGGQRSGDTLTPRKIDKSQLRCYRCHKKGHFKHECPKKKKDENSDKGASGSGN